MTSMSAGATSSVPRVVRTREEAGYPPAEPGGIFYGLTVGVYSRISDDRQESGEGVGHQATDGERKAFELGAARVIHYVENDTSAYKQKRLKRIDDSGNVYFVYRVIRPEWQAYLTDLRSGTITGAIVTDLDRLARDPRDLEDAIEVRQHYNRSFRSVSGSLKLDTDADVAMARIMVTIANKSSADTARRQRDHHRHRAMAGEPMGGVRPFGWNEDKRTLKKDEAEELRRVVGKLLAKVSFSSVVRDLRQREVKTARGGLFTWAGLMVVLRNPRMCGMRSTSVKTEHLNGSISAKWEIVIGPDGKEVTGNWEPVITRNEWEALIAVIGEGGAPVKPASIGRKYLLSGICRCGNCGHRMHGVRVAWGSAANFQYLCAPYELGGCGDNSRSGPKIDDMIVRLVFELDDEATAAHGGDVAPIPWEKEHLLKDVETNLAEAYTAWKAKSLPSPDYFAIRADLESDRKQLIRERATHEMKYADPSEAVANIRERWDDPRTMLEEKAAFITQYLSAVVVNPLPRVTNPVTGKSYKPGKLWRPELIEPIPA